MSGSGFKAAFALKREEVAVALPPGTITSVELAERERQGDFILSPTPSNDPADPLNWPMWRKQAVLACMALDAFVANFSSSSISSAFYLLSTPIAFNPPVPMDKLSRLVAVNALMLGAANLIWVPLANSIGRRAVLLLGLLVLMLSSVWAGKASTYESLLAARLFMGIGGAPADTISPKAVGEVFFVHQSGRAMGIYTLFLAIGPTVGGVSGGYIAARVGLDWVQWVNVILAGGTLVLCFLLVPETMFEREEISAGTLIKTEEQKSNVTAEEVERVFTAQPGQHARFTFARSLGFPKPKLAPLAKVFNPFKTLRLPGVLLVMFWYAGLVGGIVTMSTLGPQLVAGPPYLWKENAGLINIGGVIGSFLGLIFTVVFADRALKAKQELDCFFVEPESRLPIAFPGLILATCGLWVFGFCAEHPSENAWVGLQFGIGMLTFGIMQVPSIGFNYLIECYGPLTADCFTIVTLMRSIISFSWTFFVGEWATSAGPSVPFGVFGGLMGLFSVMSIPVWLWGKRFRIATEKWLVA